MLDPDPKPLDPVWIRIQHVRNRYGSGSGRIQQFWIRCTPNPNSARICHIQLKLWPFCDIFAENSGLPLTWLVALTTVQHYRAECEKCGSWALVHVGLSHCQLSHCCAYCVLLAFWSYLYMTVIVVFRASHFHVSVLTLVFQRCWLLWSLSVCCCNRLNSW